MIPSAIGTGLSTVNRTIDKGIALLAFLKAAATLRRKRVMEGT
jgi:hypothetical protein